MNKMIKAHRIFFLIASLALASPAWSLDSYRYLHVSIETPWRIFLFLIIGIFAPFIVLAYLYWRQAQRSRDSKHNVDDEP